MLRENLINKKIPSVLPAANIHTYDIQWREGGVDPEEHPPHAKYLREITASVIENVRSQVKSAITKKQNTIPQSEYYTEFEEGLHHLNFCEVKCSTFKGQTGILNDVKQYLETNTKRRAPLVVYAESGVGKTSLMAMAMKLIPDWFGPDCIRMIRFLGTSPYSSDVYSMLRSIAGQLADCFGIIMEPVGYSNMKKLIDYFPRLLRNVSRQTKTPIFILLDSIDQLSPNDGAYRMKWLPAKLPMRINIIISTLPNLHGILDNTRHILPKKEHYLQLVPIQEQTGRQIMASYLEKKGRTLTNDQMLIIFSVFSENPSPLFLKLLLDFSLQWRSYTHTGKLHITLARSVTAAIDQLFDNLENMYGNLLIKYAFGYLTVGVNGLSELELEDVLSCNDQVLDSVYQYHDPPVPGIVHIPPLLWARIRNDINEYVVERQSFGKTTMFWYHRQFIDMATKRYANSEVYESLHSDLVEMYMSERSLKRSIILTHRKKTIDEADRQTTPQPMTSNNKRMIFALPYHLQESGKIDKLKKVALCNLNFMKLRIQAFSLDALLLDYSKALQDDGKSESDVELTLIRNCLLDIRPLQNVSSLPVQLLSRLVYNINTPNIDHLLEDAKLELIQSKDPSLLPMYPCLSSEDMLLWSSSQNERIVQVNKTISHIMTQDMSNICIINLKSFRNIINVTKIQGVMYRMSEKGSMFTLEYLPDSKSLRLCKYIATATSQTATLFPDKPSLAHDVMEEKLELLVSDEETYICVKYGYRRAQLWSVKTFEKPTLIYDTSVALSGVTIDSCFFQSSQSLILFVRNESGEHQILVNGSSTKINIPGFVKSDNVRLVNENEIRCLIEADGGIKILTINLQEQTHKQSKTLHLDNMVSLDQYGQFAIELEKCDCTLYDAVDGNYLKTYTSERNKLTSAYSMSDGDYMVGTDSSGCLIIWSTETFKVISNFKSHENSIVHFSSYGDSMLTQDADNIVRVWSLSAILSASLNKTLHRDTVITDIQKLSNSNLVTNVISVGGETLLTNDENGSIKIWSMKTEKCIQVVSPNDGSDLLKVANVRGIYSVIWLNTKSNSLNYFNLTNQYQNVVKVLPNITEVVQTFAVNEQLSRLLVLSRTNDDKSILYEYSLHDETVEKCFQIKGKLQRVNIDLSYSCDEKYALLNIQCFEKERNIILASEKKGNLFPSTGCQKFAAIDLAKTGSTILQYCNRILTNLPCLGTCWEMHTGNNVIIGKDRSVELCNK